MAAPLVTISSAFYNETAYLRTLIKSVFAQTFTDWELILLDDGSTDNSLEIAQSIDDPRVKVFTNGQNRGRSYSLNRLATLAQGKYLARFDADDMCSITRIEKQVRFLESNPGVDAVGTGICYLNKDDDPVGCWHAPQSHEQICENPDKTLNICHGSLLGKKSWFGQWTYDTSLTLSVDGDMLYRAYKNSTFANIPEPLYYYRLDQSCTLRKQFTSRYYRSKYLFRYHAKQGRYGKAISAWTLQYGKYISTVLMCATGLRKRLMQRRYENLSPSEISAYENEIHKIKSIELPLKRINNERSKGARN